MKRVLFLSYIVCLLVCGSFVFAELPENWTNTSFVYGHAFNRAKGAADTLGFDVSNYSFFGGTVGMFERTSLLWGLGSDDDLRLNLSLGPSLTTLIAGGASLYAGIGPVLTLSSYQGKNYSEFQVGACLDLGIRIRFTSSPIGEMGLIGGATGMLYFYHDLNKTPIENLSGDVQAYLGISYGRNSNLRLPYSYYL
ncbi:MAG: hypothetical protein WC159_09330 [Sphaerochaetaceae bacterium]